MFANRPGRSHGTGPYGQSYGALWESGIGQGLSCGTQPAVRILAYLDPRGGGMGGGWLRRR